MGGGTQLKCTNLTFEMEEIEVRSLRHAASLNGVARRAALSCVSQNDVLGLRRPVRHLVIRPAWRLNLGTGIAI